MIAKGLSQCRLWILLAALVRLLKLLLMYNILVQIVADGFESLFYFSSWLNLARCPRAGGSLWPGHQEQRELPWGLQPGPGGGASPGCWARPWG